MCGRVTQHRRRIKYASEVGWAADYLKWLGDRVADYNVAPGSWPWLMHTLHEGKESIDTVHWGYRPEWAIEKGLPEQINARVESAVSKPYYRGLMRTGRVIVPADGWYEWTGEKGHKQPWYIRLKSDRPMFLAALTNWRPYTASKPGTGFVIVTEQSDAGMVDVHDRRPVVLAADDARSWMDNSRPAEQAEQLARSCSLPPDAFEWYRVSTDVNSTQNDSRHLIEPVS